MRAIVISGGGARIAQAQLLIESLKLGVPDFYVGSSAGGLLAMLQAHLGVSGARHELMKITRRKDIFSDNISYKGFWSPEPLQKLMARVVKTPKQRPYYVCAYNLAEQKKVYFKHSDGWWHMSSTACIPVLVTPVDGIYIDGGVVENTPLKHAIERGATEIDLVMCSAKDDPVVKVPKNIVEIASASYEAMRLEMAANDVELCKSRNNKVRYKEIDVRIHYPPKNILGILEFDKIKAALSGQL